MKILADLVIVAVTMTTGFRSSHAASVKPDDQITPENASAVADLVSPGNLYLVKQGMRMKIVPTDHIDYVSIWSSRACA